MRHHIFGKIFSVNFYLFLSSNASFVGLIFFGIRNDIAQFYGMMFIFLLTTVLMAPNVVDYFRMPGFELKRYVREARDLTNEIKEIARRVGAYFDRTGIRV